ncbi:hypothetical protein [Streptomyces sp. NPDC059928]|uniref:hypothetical protein n=1 Tax=unclassified Streptomyces TaxID=2593676 RepID=UPI00365C4A70
MLADSVALTGDAGKVITIADMTAARHGVRFSAGTSEHVGESLAEAARAQAEVEARRNQGKAVLVP